MPDLTYQETLNVATREKAKLRIALDPTASPLVYIVVPVVQNLGGFRRNPTVNRQDLFADASGQPQEAVTVKHKLGPQSVTIAGSPKAVAIQQLITKGGPDGAPKGNAVMAEYTDAQGMVHQGQALWLFLGEAGAGPADTTAYEFTLEWTRAGAPTFPV